MPFEGYFVRLTREDSGRHCSVNVGEQVTLTLPETPTTGYEWKAEVDPELLRELENRFDPDSAPRGAAGARIITFEAIAVGPTPLRCDRRRAWEGTAAEQFQVYLDITT
jgi:inhibitor of cysteine peptidase